MHELISSFSLVAIAEIGDKTQILSIILAARYRKFWPIFFGILLATLLNHGASAYIGKLIADFIDQDVLKYIVAITFIALGIWILKPDGCPDEHCKTSGMGAFTASLVAFFLAEIGDKTQLVTITLGARFDDTLVVTIGTTLGMMAANIPALLLGQKILRAVPLDKIRIISSILFIGFGISSLFL
jgi:putative Ca2+/H+ antiporter (TMEM165/GDT1 family)